MTHPWTRVLNHFCHLHRDAICLACENRPEQEVVQCVHCRQDKDRRDFDEVMLQRWRKHREVKKKATCQDYERKDDEN